MGLRNKLLSVRPQQWGGQQMLPSEDPEALDQIVAVPGETDATDPTFMPEEAPAVPEGAEVPEEEQMPPSEEESEPTEALQTEMPEPEEVSGKDIEARFQPKEEPSEYDQDEEAIAAAENRARMMSGIGGAVQAFGEGLAAITGGSPTGLRVGVQSFARAGADEAESLKDKIKRRREKESSELSMRDKLEERQKKIRLKDPTSDESKRAREFGGLMIDQLIASYKEQNAGQESIDKLLNVKAALTNENATAEQIAQLSAQLKEFGLTKPKESVESQQAWKMKLQDTAWDRKQKDYATKLFDKDVAKMGESVRQFNGLTNKLEKFSEQLAKAQAGDEEAKNYIRQYKGMIGYLLGRQEEPKGVFTDQDARILNVFESGKSWEEASSQFIQEGTAELNEENMGRMRRALDNAIPTLKNAKKSIIQYKKKQYAQSDNEYVRNYGERITSDLFPEASAESSQAQPAQSQPTGVKQFKDSAAVSSAVKENKVVEGDLVQIGEKTYKYSKGRLIGQ